MSDRLFVDDIEKAARLHNAAVKSPVFSYYFDYRGKHSQSEVRTGSNVNIGLYNKHDHWQKIISCSIFLGVSHADDTAYVLYSNMDTLSTDDDREMTKIMVDLFTSFMENG